MTDLSRPGEVRFRRFSVPRVKGGPVELVRAYTERRSADELLRQRSAYYERLARDAETVRECERFADQAVMLLEVAVALREKWASS